MKNITHKIPMLFGLLILALTACTDDLYDIKLPSDSISITASASLLGGSSSDTLIVVPVGSEVYFSFDINSEIEISSIELWEYKGVGVNKQAPTMLQIIEYPIVQIGNSYILSDTIGVDTSLHVDSRYAVYVEDLDGNYNNAQISMFLDVNRYSNLKLFDGMSEATSATFLDLESGRTLYAANTIAAPEDTDLGFAFIETDTNLAACLVSFDDYYNAGNYAMVVNDRNAVTLLKDASSLFNPDDSLHIYDVIITAADLEGYFTNAEAYPADASAFGFSDNKIASKLSVGDIIAFKNDYGRYGLIQITEIDDKDFAPSNNQTINFDMIIQK